MSEVGDEARPEAILLRVARLERANMRLKRACLASVLLLGAICFLGQTTRGSRTLEPTFRTSALRYRVMLSCS